jgi:ABC-type multidrug transport system fused ATPase/permease subunit
VRRQVSIVLQDPFLLSGTIYDNIAYGRPGASRREVIEAARAAHADEFIERLPDGYASEVAERGVTFSGGQRQRIAIARALLMDTPILILDEPTSAVDRESEDLIMQALRRLISGRTVIIISHRQSTTELAQRAVVLRDGRIVEEGAREIVESWHAYLAGGAHIAARATS